jgi:hypothetical protein
MILRGVNLHAAMAGLAVCVMLPVPAFGQSELAGQEAPDGGLDEMEPNFADLDQLGVRVADTELSHMRGRFATPNGISYFGLEMATSWQTPDGITTQARLAINFDFGGVGGNPLAQAFVSWERDEGDDAIDVRDFGQQAQGGYVAVTNSGVVPVGGLDTVHGAVQSQQIAGADNSVRNSMTVAIVPVADAKVNTEGMTPLTAGSMHSFADGDSLRFLVNGKEVGIVMTGGGSDAVRQTVNSGTNQLAQHVRINSDANDIASRMNLSIGLDPAAQANRTTANNLLDAMRSNGF